MSVYVFRSHNGGYIATVYGVHVGQVKRVHYGALKTGWQPVSEHDILPTERTRQKAARALWEDHQARMRDRSA